MATLPQVRVVSAENTARQRRRHRRPVHPFNIKSRPFEITPFCIAPVLPGETLDDLFWQSRVVSDPILNSLIGWHKEYYYFYVPLRTFGDPKLASLGLAWDTNEIVDLFTAGTQPTGMEHLSVSVPMYSFKGAFNYVTACLYSVVYNFFRDEDDLVEGIIENYPGTYADRQNVFNSVKAESATGDDTELPGVDEIEELDILPGYTNAYAQWEIMRDAGWTDVTFNDYLKSAGVSVAQADEVDASGVKIVKPELIRFSRSWTYPTNAVDPMDGSVASAVSWSIKERADKRRFFKEPGFVFGCTVTRPKIYLGNQKGAAVGLLKTINHWLPPVLQGYPYTSVVEELDSATDGILINQTEDYWLDIKDLFLYGDQFVNHAMSVADNHGLALPDDTTVDNTMMFTTALVKSFFVDAAGTANYIREDGVTALSILSPMGGDTTKA